MLHEPLGFLQNHVRHLYVTRGGLVEGRADDLAPDGALHVRHLFGPLVNEQDDEMRIGEIRGDAFGDGLKEHGLAGAGRGDDQPALAKADGGHQVQDAHAGVLG